MLSTKITLEKPFNIHYLEYLNELRYNLFSQMNIKSFANFGRGAKLFSFTLLILTQASHVFPH